ncbi:DUF4097 family beta strand repeat-containing protein [Streptomyces sp. NPDC058682]|uniref:DUF4097 family beta strand repeat-containing protein n=1 Tax=Streptomyces sp. NPDC058682 TaxID=3346596 RepID=UPI00364F1AEB
MIVVAGAWLVTIVLPAREDYSSTSTVNAADSTLLRVDTDGAGVTLRAGNDSSVHVAATGDYTDTRPEVSAVASGATTTVSASCAGSCSLRLEITLPAGLATEVSSGAGEITASDLTGRLALNTKAGAINVTNPGGPLVLHSGSGQIVVAGAKSPRFDATTKEGEVRAAFTTAPTTTNVTTDQGGVDLALPPHAGYYVEANSESATPQISVPVDRNAKNTVTVKTGSGGVDIH